MADQLRVEEFGMGSLPVILVAVKHTKLQDKGMDRPCSFFFMLRTFFYHMLKKIPVVWCATFSGTSVEHFLSTSCREDGVITDCFTQGGRGVQLWNSLRYLEFLHTLCAAMDRGVGNGGIPMDVGTHYMRAAVLMTGWFIHPEGMTVKNDQPTRFVQREPLGTTILSEWHSGLARFLAEGPESLSGSSESRLSRSHVTTTKGQHSCLACSCGNGYGTLNCEDDVCMHCTMLGMVWEGCEKRDSLESALRALKPTRNPPYGTRCRGLAAGAHSP